MTYNCSTSMCNYIRNNTHTHTMVHFVMNFIYSSSMLRKYARRCKFVWLHWVGLSQISASAHFSVFHFVFRQTCNGYQLPLIRLLMDWCIVTISLKTVRIVYSEKCVLCHSCCHRIYPCYPHTCSTWVISLNFRLSPLTSLHTMLPNYTIFNLQRKRLSGFQI